MREIKFRALDKENKVMMRVWGWSPTAVDLLHPNSQVIHSRDWKTIELMQFTGLKDKNGVEIFEGDIVKQQDLLDGSWYNSTVEIPNCYSFGAKTLLSMAEVIGNIYENPELIKRIQ